MKDINEMSYRELLEVGQLIEIAKGNFYSAHDLTVVQGHLCITRYKVSFEFLSKGTPEEYRDVFSDEFVATYNMLDQLPSLAEALNENNIPFNTYMRLNELENVWNQYKKTTEGCRKLTREPIIIKDMKNFNEMSYQELLDLEKSIEIAKSNFYFVHSLAIVQGHLCTTTKGNYKLLGIQTPVTYCDIFSGEVVATSTLMNQLPSFVEALFLYGIPFVNHMRLDEIKNIWDQYKKATEGCRKLTRESITIKV